MINNFKQISELLTFNSKDEFYFVQILQRKKDNPNGQYGSNNSSRLVKAYYIKSIEELFKLKDEMIHFAEYFNARIGINLNKRSFEKTAFNTLKKIAEQMHNKNFRHVKRAWNTSCEIHNSVDDKVWILDIDELDFNCLKLIEIINDIEPIGNKYVATIPSKNGCHLIMKPFNLSLFYMNYTDIEIHKNNPTNLYIP